MASVSIMKFLPAYSELTDSFDPEEHDDDVNAYTQYSQTLLLHLQKDTTILAIKTPKVTLVQQEHLME